MRRKRKRAHPLRRYLQRIRREEREAQKAQFYKGLGLAVFLLLLWIIFR